MSKYYLKADYDITSLKFHKTENTIFVDIPMLSNNKLNYGLEHVKTILYNHNIFPSELGFDIITLATIVYLADTRIKRAIHGQDSWTREIILQLPVSNVNLWNRQVKTIKRMLRFLTGDLWSIKFVKRDWKFKSNEETKEKTTLYNRASLFSGGMDSLISTINLMEQRENTLLFGHAGESLTKNAQTNIISVLDEQYPKIDHTLINLWMNFPDNYIPEGGNDSNTRSRSFLFIGFGIFSITGIKNVKKLMVPENGLIALNVPLEMTRVGSFSTRTTHPFYLTQWNNLLKNLGLDLSIYNPYWNKTKGEMAAECLNKDVLFKTMRLSFSCSSPGKARWGGLSPQHCGYCVPCLIRRAAMYKAFGKDNTIYMETSIRHMQNNSASGIGLQLRSFQYAIKRIKKLCNIEKISIHKSGPLPQNENYLSELASIYKRGLLEVDTFIQDNLNNEECHRHHDL